MKKYPTRNLTGMQRCLHPCNVCPYMLITKNIQAKTGELFHKTGLYGCQTIGVIYLVSCLKCKMQYVGQSGRRFHDRAMEHLRSITAKDKTVGEHFTTNKHKDKDFRIQVIEKVYPNTDPFRLERENYWIRTLKTLTPHGLNRQINT